MYAKILPVFNINVCNSLSKSVLFNCSISVNFACRLKS